MVEIFFFFLITEYSGSTVVVQIRDRSEHGSEGHQVSHRITVFGLGCCSPYKNYQEKTIIYTQTPASLLVIRASALGLLKPTS
ncbi:hypothetical protein YC2023_090903 [Brassica napus]